MSNQLTSRVITLTPDELARWERGERHWIVPGEPYSNLTITPAFHDNPDPIVLPPVRWRDAVGKCPTCGGSGTTRRKMERPTAPDGYRLCAVHDGDQMLLTLGATAQITHLVRSGESDTVCGLTRFGKDADLPGWSMDGGGVFGPNIEQRSCSRCWQCLDCRGTGLLLTELRATCDECHVAGTLDLDAEDYLAAGIGWADGADDRPGLEDCHDCSGEGSVLVATVSVEVLPVVDRDTMAGATATGPRVIVVRPYLGVGGGTYLSTQSHVSLDLDPLPTPGRDFVVVPTEVPA